MNMKSPFPKVGLGQEKGFTLIELIMVIVLLGILAAVAIPRYQNLQREAALAACDGVFGAAQGIAAINFATRLVSPTGGTVIDDGNSLTWAFDGGVLPDGWNNRGVAFAPAISATVGGVTCQITINPVQNTTQMARFTKSW